MTDFLRDVLDGLSQVPKRLPSRYFYDDKGSALFQEIMQLDEYYLPACELEILQEQAEAIGASVAREGLQILELGAGDGTKTLHLLHALLANQQGITYRPMDISSYALEENRYLMQKEFPSLQILPSAGDYFQTLPDLCKSKGPKLILFMGSNLGNFPGKKAEQFLAWISGLIDPGDGLLLGLDLKKDPHIILKAYDDPKGVTAQFNLNLLTRINRELGADFDLNHWLHWPIYDPIDGAAKSYLLSTCHQRVHFPSGLSFSFEPFEAIFMEVSQKFSRNDVENLALMADMEVKRHFLDEKAYYMVSLLRKK